MLHSPNPAKVVSIALREGTCALQYHIFRVKNFTSFIRCANSRAITLTTV